VENQPTFTISIPCNVIGMSVRENYGVNVVRLNACRFQIWEESSSIGAQTIISRIYQDSMLTCIDY
jgi:hypothetical protein